MALLMIPSSGTHSSGPLPASPLSIGCHQEGAALPLTSFWVLAPPILGARMLPPTRACSSRSDRVPRLGACWALSTQRCKRLLGDMGTEQENAAGGTTGSPLLVAVAVPGPSSTGAVGSRMGTPRPRGAAAAPRAQRLLLAHRRFGCGWCHWGRSPNDSSHLCPLSRSLAMTPEWHRSLSRIGR